MAGEAYVVDPADVTSGSYRDLRPASGEVVIHNIAVAGSAELYLIVGANEALIDTSEAGTGGWMNTYLHCTAAKGWRVKNTSGATQKIGADGIVTT